MLITRPHTRMDGDCYLDTLVEQMHDVAARHQSLNMPVQTLTSRYRLTFASSVCYTRHKNLCEIESETFYYSDLRQSRKKIEGDDHEVFVGQLELVGVLDVGDVLVEGLFDEGDTPLVHRLTVRQETLLQRCRHAGRANI